MADWQGGPLAVSAVPGAGKSHGMAVAAAIAIARNRLHRQRQLIVVTFTRSAAANLKARIRHYLRTLRLPQGGFVVHTLHGLALNIATRYPELSGLSLNSTTLVSPNQSHRVIRACVEQWVAENPRLYQVLLEGRHFDGEETERLRRQSVLRTEVLPTLAHTVIHEAKSSGLFPMDLRRLSEQTPGESLVLAIAAGLYEHYQNLLRLRNLIDYDDMILAALRVLENESVRQWQNQVFAVFEDEAQDSTPLQTRLLEILASTLGAGEQESNLKSKINLVRVGDSNQAINSTFTPADPIFFRRFCEDCNTQGRLATMAQAGRSSQIIIDAANSALEWVNRSHLAGTEQPFQPQSIYPVNFDDPQPDANPTSEGQGLELYTPRDIYHTIQLIAQRVADLLTKHPQGQAAVLVRENKQGRFVSEVLANPSQYGVDVNLSQYGIEVYDVGERDRHSRVPAEILALLQFIDRPHSPNYLKTALGVLVERQLVPNQDLNAITSLPEQFLYPGPLDPPQPEPVGQARHLCSSLLRARIELPHYQLISFLALALKYDQAELATADKLAERVARQTATEPSMAATLNVLNEIVSSERFEPVETEDTERRFTRSGQLTVITMHKAKGLDWDYVFLPFLHEQTIPGSPWVPSQAQFVGDFTLAEVARAQIRASLHGQYPLPQVGTAWEQAKHLKIAEEFRLLYVAMTRAKRLLWMAAAQRAPFWGTFNWNKQDSLSEKKPCPILQPLKAKFPSSVCPCQRDGQ
jgi:DNA helicase-2/ATP-dependent DNA helicase PcrA